MPEASDQRSEASIHSPEAPKRVKGPIRHFTDLIVYRRAFALAMQVFKLSQRWPSEERYALTDQVRRSSRAVGANIAEAWAKRRYPAHWVSKLTDADGEGHETEHWIGCAFKHGYITREEFDSLRSELHEVGKMLGAMMARPTAFGVRSLAPDPGSGPLSSDLL